MKYLIMIQADQASYDSQAGKAADGNNWTEAEIAAMYSHMGELNNDLAESGELVTVYGLGEPREAKLVTLEDGKTVVSDGPYGETKEVVAGFWIVDVESEKRAIEIADRANRCPVPAWLIEEPPIVVRPIPEGPDPAEG